MSGVGVDISAVVRVRVCLERSLNHSRRRAKRDLFLINLPVVDRNLRCDLPDDGVEPRVDVFDVILVHDFLLNNGRVLALLGEARVHEQKLGRKNDL